MEIFTAIVVSSIGAGTPLVFAAMGELVVEKSGVLNLGVEGMMLVGAIVAFMVGTQTGNIWLGCTAGALAGMMMALLFGAVALTCMASQVAAGLALTIFGTGLSAYLGKDYTKGSLDGLATVHIPLLSDLPVVGPIFFSFDPLVYFSLALSGAIFWFLYRTRPGLILRAVGESPDAAHVLGYPVIFIRYLALLFGGALAGLGGAYLALVYNKIWMEQMTSGRGWIAIALVVFATWRPARVLLGSYVFGGVTIIAFFVQGAGYNVPAQLLNALPYLATIAVLVVISRDANFMRLNAPVSLGQPYRPTY